LKERKPLTPEQKEKRRIYMSEWNRRQRELYPEKHKESILKWRAKNPDKTREYSLKWIAKLSEEDKEQRLKRARDYGPIYYRENKELIAQTKREYRARNPEKVQEWEKRRVARQKLRQEPKVGKQPTASSAAEAKNQLLLQNMAFAAAIQHIPRHLPQDMRDDLMSDIVVACLESKIRVEEVKKCIPKFIAAHNKAAGYNVSLDAEMGDGMRMIDMITEENLPW
jgi:hypothetical protein